jgi:hypothetical protein
LQAVLPPEGNIGLGFPGKMVTIFRAELRKFEKTATTDSQGKSVAYIGSSLKDT